MRHLRLYLIGIVMGIADLIPGVSGGTIAFISGIYEELLASIKTLQFQSFKKIAWPFLLSLGSGILTSILLFAKVFYFLLLHYKAPLFGFFFGMIAASILILLPRKGSLSVGKDPYTSKMGLSHLTALLGGFALSFGLTLLPSQLLFGSSFFGIVVAGMFGTGAMLLPGISGSFLLQIIGVYPLVIYALAVPSAPGSLKLLMALGLGISLGFIIFSRFISFLLSHFHRFTLCVLVGFMAGGLRVLWPFEKEAVFLPAFFLILGFFTVISLDMNLKRLRANRRVSN